MKLMLVGLLAFGAVCPSSIRCQQHSTIAMYQKDELANGKKFRTYVCKFTGKDGKPATHTLTEICD